MLRRKQLHLREIQRPDVRPDFPDNSSIDTHVESSSVSLSGPGFESLQLHMKKPPGFGGLFLFIVVMH